MVLVSNTYGSEPRFLISGFPYFLEHPKGHYGIYTRVAKFEKWIKRTIGLEEDYKNYNRYGDDYSSYEYEYYENQGYDEEHMG